MTESLCCVACQRELDAAGGYGIHDVTDITPFGCHHTERLYRPTPQHPRPCYCTNCAEDRGLCMRCGNSRPPGMADMRKQEEGMFAAMTFVLFAVLLLGIAILLYATSL